MNLFSAPFREILLLRARLFRRTLAGNQAAQAILAAFVFLLLPAAYAIGANAAKALAARNPAAPAVITTAVLLLHAAHLLLLVFGDRLGVMPERVASSVLLPLPVGAATLWASDALACLLSLPTLLFAAGWVPLVQQAGIAALIPGSLLFLLGVALALLIPRCAAWLARLFGGGSRRRIVALTVVGICLVLLSRSAPPNALATTLGSRVHTPVRLPGDPPPPPPPPVPALLRFSPPGLVAQVLLTGNTLSVALLVTLLLAAGTAGFALSGQDAPTATASSRRSKTGAVRSAGAFVTEMRLLLRDPAAHLPLREPATLLFALLTAFVMANPDPNPARNVSDLSGIGATLYLILYQTQFLTNRFGSEGGTAAMRFSLAAPIRRVLAAKNAALFVLLFALDGAVVSAFALAAGNPRFVVPLLAGLAATLAAATALGNLVSLLMPFAIARRATGVRREPPRELTFGYAVFFGAVWAAVLPAQWLVARLGWDWGTLPAALYLLAVYAASVVLAARLLTPTRERALIAALDGVS